MSNGEFVSGAYLPSRIIHTIQGPCIRSYILVQVSVHGVLCMSKVKATVSLTTSSSEERGLKGNTQ